MSDNCFDRAPGAGRGRGGGAPLAPESGAGLGMSFGGPDQLLRPGFPRPQEPLRPPKTAPPGSNAASGTALASAPPSPPASSFPSLRQRRSGGIPASRGQEAG